MSDEGQWYYASGHFSSSDILDHRAIKIEEALNTAINKLFSLSMDNRFLGVGEIIKYEDVMVNRTHMRYLSAFINDRPRRPMIEARLGVKIVGQYVTEFKWEYLIGQRVLTYKHERYNNPTAYKLEDRDISKITSYQNWKMMPKNSYYTKGDK